MRQFRLQKAYLLAGWAIAIGVILLGGFLFKLNLDKYLRDREDTRELQRFHLALVATSAIVAERGPANNFMDATPDTARQLWAILTTTREETDRALATMEASFQEQSFVLPSQEGLAQEVRQRLHDARLTVDATAARHLEDRAAPGFRTAVENMFAAADLVEALRDDLGRDIIRNHPQIGAEILFVSMSSTMRDEAGRLGSYLIISMQTGGSSRADLPQKMANVRGRLAELRALTWRYGSVLLADPAIGAVLTDVDRAFFSDALIYAQKIEQAEEHGASDKFGAAEFSKHYVAGMAPIESLRKSISDISRKTVEASEARAFRALAVVAALIVAVCVVLTLIGALLHRMLFLPLMQAREQLVALAEGDLSDPSSPRRGSQEVQDLFRGVMTLREELRVKKALERSQERIAARLKRLSETDPLTGLRNRRTLGSIGRRLLKDAARTGKQTGLIMFDVDHFKRVNDAFGHNVGDAVLKGVVETVQFRLRSRDHFFRYGGEEFVVLAEIENEDEARMLAERLRLSLRYVHIVGLPDLVVSASFGVVVSKGREYDLEALIAEADRRLYIAKESGRNRVCAGDAAPKPLPLRRAS
jgi:diguanylate cyclase (GGDEF)-like protein